MTLIDIYVATCFRLGTYNDRTPGSVIKLQVDKTRCRGVMWLRVDIFSRQHNEDWIENTVTPLFLQELVKYWFKVFVNSLLLAQFIITLLNRNQNCGNIQEECLFFRKKKTISIYHCVIEIMYVSATCTS